jgi:hypothetical protein
MTHSLLTQQAARLLVALALFLVAIPKAEAADKCPSGAKRERGRCVCPTGQRLAPDGKRCVSSAGPSPTYTPKVTEPKVKAKGPPASGDHIPSGAKVQILGLSKDDGLYVNRSQYLGKEGVVYPSDLYMSGAAKKGDYYGGTINIDGVEYYFDHVSVTILGFGAVPTVAVAPYGDFVAGGSVIEITDLSSSDIYYKEKKKYVGLRCTVDSDGLVPTGGVWYGGPVTCDDGSTWYFYQVSFSLISSPSTTAGPCVAGASTAASVNGKRVEILDVAPEDAYYRDRFSIVGKLGYMGTDSANNGPSSARCWYGGSFTADDGTSYYFWQAQVRETTASAPSAAVCAAGASTASGFQDGQEVIILGLGAGDLYYPESSKYIGKKGRVSGDLHNNGGCNFGGGFTADDGTYTYFAEVQVSPTGAVAATPACQASAATGPNLKDGTRISILDIDPADLYYKDRTSISGKGGKVTGDLYSVGGCWYAGGFTSDDGTYYYFAKVQIRSTTAEATCAPGSATAAKLKDGEALSVLEVSPEDGYFKSKSALVGQRGKATGELFNTGGCWYSGGFTGDDGIYYYFAKVQLRAGSAPDLSKLKAYTGGALKAGTAIILLDFAAEDAYYKDRASLVGKRCKADGSLEPASSGYYGGSITCEDGSAYYLFKAKIALSK